MIALADRVRTIVFFSTALFAVWVSLVPRPASAQTTDALSDGDLYDRAREAREGEDYRAAMLYIYAYIQKDGVAMRSDGHRTMVLRFYQGVRSRAFAVAGERHTMSVPPHLPARTEGPPSPPPKGQPARAQHPLVCRGGGNLHFTYEPYSGASEDPQIQIQFARGAAGTGANMENLGALAPGQCTWRDRAISPKEPDTLVLTAPVFVGRQFSIQWQRGSVTGIASELGHVNALQNEKGIRTFRVYNDGKGNFIVSGME